MPCRPDIRYTAQLRSLKHAYSIAQQKVQQAGCIARLCSAINLVVSHPKLIQIAGDVGYVVFFLAS